MNRPMPAILVVDDDPHIREAIGLALQKDGFATVEAENGEIVRHPPSGKAVVNVTLATHERWSDRATGERQERTKWHRRVLYRPLARFGFLSALLSDLWNRRFRTTPALRATPPYPRRGNSTTGVGVLYQRYALRHAERADRSGGLPVVRHRHPRRRSRAVLRAFWPRAVGRRFPLPDGARPPASARRAIPSLTRIPGRLLTCAK